MTFSLSRSAVAAGYRVASYDTVGSTSTEALARAVAGETGPLWVVSSEQTAGRGRRGSAWQTARGNLAASLLLTTDLLPATVAELGFVAGVALADALDEVAALHACAVTPGLAPSMESSAGTRSGLGPRDEPKDVGGGFPFLLKWPNDVLLGSAKLAGILLQTELRPDGRRSVVVGLGVNAVTAPSGLAYPTTSLSALGCLVAAETLFNALSACWAAWFDRWRDRAGFVAIREAWLTRAAGLGGPVSVVAGSSLVKGTFETIDEAGRLVIREPGGGCRTVSAGEVHFGDAASSREEKAA